MNTVLLVCTGNLCRSVMAAGMLSAALARRGVAARVSSAGQRDAGLPPPVEVTAVMAARGIDVAGHRSRQVTASDLAQADLILGLTREHVRHCVVLHPSAWPRAFTLRELVRRGLEAGPRGSGEPLADWLTRAADGRNRGDLLGQFALDDVPDPYGGPPAGYAATAGLIEEATGYLTALIWASGSPTTE